MTKVERLINEANELPEADRLRLLEAVERSLLNADAEPASRPASYTSLISIAGSAPSEFSDVSTEKCCHLADADAPRSDRRPSWQSRSGLAKDGRHG
jgi:hypothetical protein